MPIRPLLPLALLATLTLASCAKDDAPAPAQLPLLETRWQLLQIDSLALASSSSGRPQVGSARSESPPIKNTHAASGCERFRSPTVSTHQCGPGRSISTRALSQREHY